MFYRRCSRKLVKGFDGCWASANRSFGFGGQGSDGATCIIFCMSDRNLLATNWNIFPLLGRIKSIHRKLLMFPITNCSVFCYRKEVRVLKILFRVSFQPLGCLYHSNPDHVALQEGPVILHFHKWWFQF